MLDLAGGRLGVDAALAALLELEVLHRIREVDLARGRARPRRARGRAACRPDRRRAGPADPPDRPAARRRKRCRACSGPSPNTAWVAPGTSGPASRMIRLSSSSDFGSGSLMARERGLGRAFGRHRRLLLHHRSNARGRGPDEVRDGRGLGQVAPVLLRHLRAHRVGVRPGRVERALVVAAPARLERIARRRVGAATRRAERQTLAIPMRRPDRGQDRPDRAPGSARRRTARRPPG